MAINNLRQKSIFDQFNIPDLSGGTLGYGLDMNTSFMPGAKSPTYEDENTFRSSNIAGDMRTPEDIKGIGTSSNISKVSDVSTKPPEDYGDISIEDTMNAINKVYTPATRADDRLNNLLDNTPDINDYNPSFARKLVAGLQGMKDPSIGQKTLNQPYLQDMGQWTAKTAPFQAAATGENARNTQERTLAGNVVSSITSANRNAANQRIADQKNQTNQDKINKDYENKSRLATVKEYLAKNPEWEIKSEGPTYKLFNPRTQEVKETGVTTGNSTDLELANVRGKWGVEAARAGGSGLVIIDGKLGQVVQDDKGASHFVPVQGAESTGTGGGTGGSGISRLGTQTTPKPNALETARERDAKLQSIFENNNPDEVQFLKKDRTSGKVTLLPRPVIGATKPGTTTFGFGGTTYTKDDLDRWDLMKVELEPGYVPPQLTRAEQAASQGPPLNVREAPIPSDLSFGNKPPASQQAPGQPPIQTPPTDRRNDLVRLIQDPNTPPRNRQAYQAELAQLQTNESKQNTASTRDITRANEIAQALQNPNLDPRQRQSLMDQARGLPAPGQTPIGPSVPPQAPQQAGPSVMELQDQISILTQKMRNPGNSTAINQQYQNQISQLQQQLHQANNPVLGPPAPPQQPQPQPQGQPTNQQTDAQNPMMKRRSFDGGQTWQVSQDGGRTWR